MAPSRKVEYIEEDVKIATEHFDELVNKITEQAQKRKSNFEPKEFFNEVSTLWKDAFQEFGKQIKQINLLNFLKQDEVPEESWNKITDGMAKLTGSAKNDKDFAKEVIEAPQEYKDAWLKKFPDIISNIHRDLKEVIETFSIANMPEGRANAVHKLINNAAQVAPELESIEKRFIKNINTNYKDLQLSSEQYFKVKEKIKEIIHKKGIGEKEISNEIKEIGKILNKTFNTNNTIKDKIISNIHKVKSNVKKLLSGNSKGNYRG